MKKFRDDLIIFMTEVYSILNFLIDFSNLSNKFKIWRSFLSRLEAYQKNNKLSQQRRQNKRTLVNNVNNLARSAYIVYSCMYYMCKPMKFYMKRDFSVKKNLNDKKYKSDEKIRKFYINQQYFLFLNNIK